MMTIVTLAVRMKRFVIAAIACLISSLAADAAAQSKQLAEERSPNYYRTHIGLAAGGFIISGVSERVFGGHGSGPYWRSFHADDLVELNFSDSAAALSDKVLLTTVVLPAALQMSEGFDTSMANATLIYAEAHSLNIFLTTTTKLIARRPRPYTRSEVRRIVEFKESQGSDAYASFFSGHSSASFTAATAGSILYAMRTDDLWARHTVWGVEFLLAGMTAQLRVRAGRHYRSDIWTGTLVGAGIGVLVPALHGLQLSRVRGSEVAVAGATTVVTMGLSEVVDFCGVLGAFGLCSLPRDVRVPMIAGNDAAPAARFFVLPAVFEGGGGLQISGEL